MSLITQCPACSTLFKVVPDQLRISDGWVRCGQCDEVFDANANIRSDVPVTAHAGPQAPHEEMQTWSPSDEGSAPSEQDTPETSSPMDVPLDDAALPSAHVDHFLDQSPKDLSNFSAAVAAASAHEELIADIAPQEGSTERRYMQMFVPDTQSHQDSKLSFMQAANKPSLWIRPRTRIALALACVILILLIMLQVLVHQRDLIAARHPTFRAELMALCVAIGCEVKPLQQIEAVVIDSSAFSKVRNEVYKLSFTLRNTSAIALATPAMELTLTDMQDHVLMRKVLTPGDFSTAPAVMNAGAEVSATLPVSVRPPVPAERVSGYRLVAFYP